MSSFRSGRHLCLFQMPEVNNKSMEQLTTRQENMMYKRNFMHCIDIQVFVRVKRMFVPQFKCTNAKSGKAKSIFIKNF